MGLFSKGSSGGIMNVIRCDEKEYLVWKWRPNNQELGANKRENGIRYGSSLRVKDGEMAIFVYSAQGKESNQDIIFGPHDQVLNTANLPVLASIVGLAFGGDTPFQAEVYFINLAQNVQLFFGVPYFDVFDPRYPDFPIPVSVRGRILFNITDYKTFIKNNRLIDFEIDDFKRQIKSAVMKYTKSIIITLPSNHKIPAIQLESRILEVNDLLEGYLRQRFENDFGVNLKALDIEAIEINKDAPAYRELKRVTTDITSSTVQAQAEVNIKNLQDTQRISAENMEETMRIQREEMQRAQKLQTETSFLETHALNRQSDVMQAAAESLGQLGGSIDGGNGNGGFNPAGIMTGMIMGTTLGNQMSGVLNQMGQNVNSQAFKGIHTPPPAPLPLSYYVYWNNQQLGPFNESQLAQMARNNQLTPETYVWTQGMDQWVLAKDTEIKRLFSSSEATPPPFPPPSPVK